MWSAEHDVLISYSAVPGFPSSAWDWIGLFKVMLQQRDSLMKMVNMEEGVDNLLAQDTVENSQNNSRVSLIADSSVSERLVAYPDKCGLFPTLSIIC